MKIISWYDQLQELITDMCQISQLYFYMNLFDPVRDSKIIYDVFLTKKSNIIA